MLCLQPRHLLCQQTGDLQSAKTSPPHCLHRGGREAAAPVSAMPRGCLGRLQISCLLTQQMSWLQTQQMSCLQTQHMSCLQTSLVSETQHLRIIFEVLDLHLGCLVLDIHFPRECSQNIDFFQGLGAARNSVPDEADEGKMVHGWQFGP